VEWTEAGENEWRNRGNPCWDFSAFDYRPKPEPMVIYAEVSNFTGEPLRFELSPEMECDYKNTTIKKFIECND
jgi:hypothetical protein